MAKAKRTPPTSIRLSPEADGFVSTLQSATGWSISKILEHLVLLGHQVTIENPAGIKLIRHLLKTAAESHSEIVKADASATAARGKLRKAAAAVKAAK